jgi:hypothetical protein
MIPWKFREDLFNTDFEKLVLKSLEKIQIFEKVKKNSDKTAEEKLVFFITFSELLGPKEKREGETFPELWKKWKSLHPNGQPIPSWGFIKKIVQFQGKLLTSSFLQAAVAGPILGIELLRKFKVTVAPEINQIQFACTAAASPAPYLPSAAPPASPCLFSSPPVSAPVPIQLPAVVTSSQPPAISAYEVRNPEVKLSSFSSRKNQSRLDPPSFKKIPDSVPADVKALLQIFPSIVRTGDVKPTPTHGVEHHITPAATPLFLQNPAASIQNNCKLPKQSSKG